MSESWRNATPADNNAFTQLTRQAVHWSPRGIKGSEIREHVQIERVFSHMNNLYALVENGDNQMK